jgi:hypothetical protein
VSLRYASIARRSASARPRARSTWVLARRTLSGSRSASGGRHGPYLRSVAPRGVISNVPAVPPVRMVTVTRSGNPDSRARQHSLDRGRYSNAGTLRHHCHSGRPSSVPWPCRRQFVYFRRSSVTVIPWPCRRIIYFVYLSTFSVLDEPSSPRYTCSARAVARASGGLHRDFPFFVRHADQGGQDAGTEADQLTSGLG